MNTWLMPDLFSIPRSLKLHTSKATPYLLIYQGNLAIQNFIENRTNKKVTAIIEASSTGFGVYADRLPGITGYGKIVQKAKEDFLSAIEETRTAYGSNVPNHLKGDLEFECKYDIAGTFNYIGVLDAGQLAKKIGMNASLR